MSKVDLDDILSSYDNFSEDNTSEKAERNEDKTSLHQQAIKDLEQDREERKKYAKNTFVFLCIFTGITLSVLVLNGFSELILFKLSDTVLITLITTSFASVVSIFVFVMRYLFKQ